MTMSKEQIQQFVVTYLETTECQFLEKSPHHVTVKLSPRADRDLTNRPYYWGFIDRTGTEPETMTFSFVFDPERYDSEVAAKQEQEHPRMNPEAGVGPGSGVVSGSIGGSPGQSTPAAPGSLQSQQESAFGRLMGGIRPLPVLGPNRIQREELHFGSPRLKQIFEAAKRGGRCVYLFEDPGSMQRRTLLPAAYEPWLGVLFKIEFCCDMKREELHFLGVSLLTGNLDENFSARLQGKSLTPRLPENVHIEPTRLSLEAARDSLEQRLLSRLESYDDSWAVEARERLNDELTLIDAYYQDLLKNPEEDKPKAKDNDKDTADKEDNSRNIQEQYEARRGEIRWQYEPRIVVTAINSGIFHLRSLR